MKNTFLLIMLFAALLLSAREYKRVVSLTPAVTEIVYTLDAGEFLVARSEACDYPHEVKKLPVVGKIGKPDVEKILQLKADLVISDMSVPAAERDMLKRLNIKTVLLSSDKISSYCRNIRIIGNLLGKNDQAEKEIKRFSKELEQLKKERAADKTVSALILLGVNPLVSCNKNTFVSEIVELAGAVNIASNAGQSYFVISPEFAVEKNPEIAVLSGMSGDFRKHLFDISAWRYLRFIQNKAIIDSVPQECFCRLTPRTLQAVRLLRAEIKKKVR